MYEKFNTLVFCYFFFSFDVSVTRTPPRLTGLPYPSDRATRLGGSTHLSRKHAQDKMRDYMDRRVTSPSWGPPPPCKQVLNKTRCDSNQRDSKKRVIFSTRLNPLSFFALPLLLRRLASCSVLLTECLAQVRF